MKSSFFYCRQAWDRRVFGFALAVFLMGDSLMAGAELEVECTVVYQTAGGLYVDAGTQKGVKRGDTGEVRRGVEEIAQVVVQEVTKSSSFLLVVAGNSKRAPETGDSVILLVHQEAGDREAPAGGRSRELSPTLKSRDSDDELVPLLAPYRRSVGIQETGDLFHGKFWVGQLFQVETEQDSSFSITRVGTSGSYDRIGKSPWSLEWSGDFSYRTGSALEKTRDYQEPVLRLYRLSLFRRFDDGSIVRGGRFLPTQLPAVGYLDGIHLEKVLGDHIRVGGMLGFKPTRARLDLSIQEPTAAFYTTVEAGQPLGFHYSGTFGFLGSLYKGKPDRLALLVDQRAMVGSRFSIFSSSQLDFDVGGAEYRSGVNLTHMDLTADYAILPLLNLRGGFDHYERPDTRAERDLLPFQDEGFFDEGYWRYFIGGTHNLPWNFQLSEEVSFIDSPTDDYSLRWIISLRKSELPYLPGSNATLSVYNLDGFRTEGYGARLYAYLPFLDNNLSVMPSISVRTMDLDLDPENFELVDLALRANWHLSRNWDVYGGFSYAFGTELSRYLVDIGVSFRW